VGIRSVAEGFEVEGPSDMEMEPQFRAISGGHGVGHLEDGRLLLRIPQVDRGGGLVDCVNRVGLGAQFISDLVAAGL
jgi:hypothetical protein